MRDLGRLKERFLRDAPARQLGNLASELLRLSTWVQMGRDPRATVELIRKIAERIEWSGDHATEELVDVQRELCRWRRLWPLEPARSLLALRARQMSDQLLALSGLTVDQPAQAQPLEVEESPRRGETHGAESLDPPLR